MTTPYELGTTTAAHLDRSTVQTEHPDPSVERSEPADDRGSGIARVRSGALMAAIAVVGGVVLGGLTSFAQAVLPPALSSFANSAGGWTMLTFLLIWAVRARPLFAALLGIAVFEALVEGYGLVSGWRGSFYQRPFTGIFNLIGLLAGPVVGVTAALVRHHTGPWRALAVSPLSAVLLGEGIYGLTIVRDSTSPVYWTIQIVLSVGFFVLNTNRARAHWRWVALSALLVLVGAAAFSFLYTVI